MKHTSRTTTVIPSPPPKGYTFAWERHTCPHPTYVRGYRPAHNWHTHRTQPTREEDSVRFVLKNDVFLRHGLSIVLCTYIPASRACLQVSACGEILRPNSLTCGLSKRTVLSKRLSVSGVTHFSCGRGAQRTSSWDRHAASPEMMCICMA